MLSTASRIAKLAAIATLASGTLFMSGAPAMAATGPHTCTTVAAVVTKDSKPAGPGATKSKSAKSKNAKSKSTKSKSTKSKSTKSKSTKSKKN